MPTYVPFSARGNLSQWPGCGHLGYSHPSAITNSAAVSTAVHVPLCVFAKIHLVCLWGRFLEVELLGHRVNVHEIIVEIAKFPSIELYILYSH